MQKHQRFLILTIRSVVSCIPSDAHCGLYYCYPWTRLGYTFDWGNPKDEVGLSEFIIREGSTIRIHSVTSTLDYCRN